MDGPYNASILPLCLSVIIVAMIIYIAYIKIKHPFWNIQPVFHSYDFWRYWAGSPFVIQKRPIKTKYWSFDLVETKPCSNIDLAYVSKYVDLLRGHYIDSDRILVTIDAKQLSAYCYGNSYVSFFYEKQYAYDGHKLNIINYPIGAMCARPLNLFLPTVPERIIYFWDFICIHREHRSKHIARKLIQTHEFNQRVGSPDIPVSFFKKEIDLCLGVVPFVKFAAYTFYLRNIDIPRLPAHVVIVRILENSGDLSDFLYMIKDSGFFKACIIPDLGSLTSLIKLGVLYVYCLKRGEHVLGMYFIKDALTQYEDLANGGTLCCYASVSNCSDRTLFVLGFFHAIRDILKNFPHYQMLIIENLAHNSAILWKWREKHSVVFENPGAYYFYNYVVPGSPLLEKDCLIL